MKLHTWIVKEINGGVFGSADFWVCSECGAGGGPVGWFRIQAKN